MPNGDTKHLKVRVESLQRDAESLFKLLGGDSDDRLRFWEILKGITTPAVFRVVETQLEALEQNVKSATHVLKTLETNAKELSASSSMRASG